MRFYTEQHRFYCGVDPRVLALQTVQVCTDAAYDQAVTVRYATADGNVQESVGA